MMRFSSVLLVCLVFASVAICGPSDMYPVPVSEYVEKSAPNTMTFLSYPKYYRNNDGELTPVVCDLVRSQDPDWDYEVTQGIWTLRLRTDGTFQAMHEGDSFTYRLSELGIGRGSGFEPLKLGDPNWANYSVVGDTIRWSDVFPEVDLTVRYVHDILKVDVIVGETLTEDIRSQVLDEKLPGRRLFNGAVRDTGCGGVCGGASGGRIA